MSEPRKQTAEQWSQFWERGSITTFIGRFEDNYDSDVLAFWYLELRKLAEQCRIIDLATGNGALALLAARYGSENGKQFDITAVDYAEIQPGKNPSDKDRALLERINFIGNTRIEATGLEAASFDVAISQFGFEYGEPEASIQEVSRLLKPTGSKVILMMHHAESAIIIQARQGLQQVALCEDPQFHADILALQRRLTELRDSNADPATDPQAERLREALNIRTGRLHDAQTRFADPSQLAFYLETSMSVFNPAVAGAMSLEDKAAFLGDLTDQTAAYKQRMADLVASASSDADISGYESGLNSAGFDIERSETFMFEGLRFAHVIVAAR